MSLFLCPQLCITASLTGFQKMMCRRSVFTLSWFQLQPVERQSCIIPLKCIKIWKRYVQRWKRWEQTHAESVSHHALTHSCIRWVRSPSIQEHTACSLVRWLPADRRTDRSAGHTAGWELQRRRSHTDDSQHMSRSQKSHPEKQRDTFRWRHQVKSYFQ